MEGKALRATTEIPAGVTVVAFDGAVRSSKTVAQIMLWVQFVAMCIKRSASGQLAIIGRTETSAINNIVKPMQEMFGTRYIVLNRGVGTVTIFGREVLLFGANNAEAVTKIQGLTLVGALLDEAANVPEAFFAMLRSRLSAAGARLFLTTNPDHPRHWLLGWLRRAQTWIKADGTVQVLQPGELVKIAGAEEPQPVLTDWFRVTFLLDDNHWLARHRAEFVAQLKASYPVGSVFYRRMILSEWASADGQVYGNWDERTMTVPEHQLPNVERVFMAGLDYGTNHRTRAYLLGLVRVPYSRRSGLPVWEPTDEPTTAPEPCLVILAEFAPGTDTVGHHASQFLDWLDRWAPLGRPQWIAVDPAAKTFRVELFDRGLDNVMRAHNSVVPGIQVVQSLLTAHKLVVVRERCPYLIDMLPGYQWDTKATDAGRTAPVKEGDDEADALRYTVYTSWSEWRDLIPLASVKDHDDTTAEDDAA